nr:hypothetical protein [Cytophagales bacterium]
MILKRKRVIFKEIAVCLPVLFFAGLELAFRLFQLGTPLPLFVSDPQDPSYWRVNPDVSHRFYIQKENAVIGTEDIFLKVKRPDSFRIFVLGESTALGFPFRHHLSFPSMLRSRLQASFPEHLIEVINLSLTGVNSYALVEFADEVIAQQPDAVVISAGHNEYYGALGVASTSTLGRNPSFVRWAIKLRKLRTIQLASNLWSELGQNVQGHQVDLRKNLMERMVSEQEVPLDGEVYKTGLRQFEENVDITLRKFQKSQIPVFMLENISNEKDQRPFLSRTKQPDLQQSFEGEIHLIKQLEEVGEMINRLHRLLEIDDAYAEAHYLLGKAYLETMELSKARSHLHSAKEFDNLRFRAPEAINSSAKKLCSKYSATYVPLRGSITEMGEDELLGTTFFMEHLHPTIEGHFLIADLLYTKMVELAKAKLDGFHPMDFYEAKSLFPVNEVDSLYGVYATLILKEGWPFNEPISLEVASEKTMEEALAGGLAVRQIHWDDAMDKLYRHYVGEGELEKAFKVAETVAMAYPHQFDYQKKAAQLAFSLKDWQRAIYYSQVANNNKPEIDNYLTILRANIKSNNLPACVPVLEVMITRDPFDGRYQRMLLAVQEIVRLEEVVSAGTSISADGYQQLAANYLLIGNLERAKKYAEYVVDLDPQNETGQLMLAKIKATLES